MMRSLIFFAALACFPLFAQDVACEKRSPTFFFVKHREHEGVGYDDGYTTIGAFLAPGKPDTFQPFADTRLHFFNEGYFAANTGLGFRGKVFSNWAFGINAYYDVRNPPKAHFVHQFGAGLELLGRYVDFRINGYVPFGNTKTNGRVRFDRFQGNFLILKQRKSVALSCIDGEIGVPFYALENFTLYFAAGPYYLFDRDAGDKSCGGIWGGKGRISAKIVNYLNLEVDGTYDSEFKGTVQGLISLNIPLAPGNINRKGSKWKSWYPAPKCEDYGWMRSLLTQPVERNEIIPICSRTINFPLFGSPTPKIFHFVDNTSAGGDGTFERPFPTLAAASAASNPGEVIYIFPGDATTTGYDVGVTLQADQDLLGSGVSHTVVGSPDSTSSADIFIPPLSNLKPMITNTAADSDVVTLDDNNQVAGLVIVNATRNGISTTGATTDYLIRNNVILDATNEGISDMRTTSGMGTIVDNDISGSGFRGMGFGETPADVNPDLCIYGNCVSNTGGDFDIAMCPQANPTAPWTIDIRGNAVDIVDGPVHGIKTLPNVAGQVRSLVRSNISSFIGYTIIDPSIDICADMNRNKVREKLTVDNDAGGSLNMSVRDPALGSSILQASNGNPPDLEELGTVTLSPIGACATNP